MKRKIEQILLDWKNTPNHKPLIIKGVRQCGKTYSVLKFAKENYKYVIYLDFVENPRFKQIFEGALDVDTICSYISLVLDSKDSLVPGKTCIILDEIQQCPKARTSLKFFMKDGRYDVIGTGSLLGVQGYNEDESISVPVGYETVVNMYPMDFEEFLWANGINENVISQIRNCKNNIIPVPDFIHNLMREKLLHYVVVGGMPEVVKEFVNTKLFNKVIALQRNIVNSYRDDMVKYASKEDKGRIRECFDSIPKQLAKENKKFQYNKARPNAKARDFLGCLKWLEDAGIIIRCYNTQITELPLEGNAIDNIFKVYMGDIGLFVSMLEDGTQFDIINGNLGAYKGAIFENIMADILGKNGRKLYYFQKESGLEIDFLVKYKGECVLVECKAKSSKVQSSNTILNHPEKYHVYNLIKFGDYNVGKVGPKTTLPFYMAFLLDEY